MNQQTRERVVTRRTLLKGAAAGAATAGASGSVLAGTDGEPGAQSSDGEDNPAIAGGTRQADGGNESDGDTPAGESEDGEETAATPIAAGTLVAMLVLGFLSPIVFVLLVRRRMRGPRQ